MAIDLNRGGLRGGTPARAESTARGWYGLIVLMAPRMFASVAVEEHIDGVAVAIYHDGSCGAA